MPQDVHSHPYTIRNMSEPSLVAAIFKRLSLILPIRTGSTLTETELDLFFIECKHSLKKLSETVLFEEILIKSCILLEEINKEDHYAVISSRTQASRDSVLVVLMLVNGACDSNRKVNPSPLNSEVFKRLVNIATRLKSGNAVLKKIQWLKRKTFKSTDTSSTKIDIECNNLVKFLTWSNGADFLDFVIPKLSILKQSTNDEEEFIPHIDLLGLLHLDAALTFKYLRLIWGLYDRIRKPLHQQLVLIFFSKSVDRWIRTQTTDFVNAISHDSGIPLQADQLFDYVYSHTDVDLYNRSSKRILSTLIALIPKGFEKFSKGVSTSKLRLTLSNKKMTFLTDLTLSMNPKGLRGSSALDAMVSLIIVGGCISQVDPTHPMVNFAVVHSPLVFYPLSLSNPDLYPPGSDSYKIDKLRCKFFAATLMLDKQTCLKYAKSVINDSSNLASLQIVTAALRQAQNMPQLNSICSKFTQDNSFEMKKLMREMALSILEDENDDSAISAALPSEVSFKKKSHLPFFRLSGSSTPSSSNSLRIRASSEYDEETPSPSSISEAISLSCSVPTYMSRSRDPRDLRMCVLDDLMSIFTQFPISFLNTGDDLESTLMPVIRAAAQVAWEVMKLGGRDPISSFAIELATSTSGDSNEIAKNRYLAVSAIISALASHMLEPMSQARLRHTLCAFVNLYELHSQFFCEGTDLLPYHSNGGCSRQRSSIKDGLMFCMCMTSRDIQRLTLRAVRAFGKEVCSRNHPLSCLQLDEGYFSNELKTDIFVVTGMVALRKRLKKLMQRVRSEKKDTSRIWELIYNRWVDSDPSDSTTDYAGVLAACSGHLIDGSNDRMEQLVDKFVCSMVSQLQGGDANVREFAREILSNEFHPRTAPLVVSRVVEMCVALCGEDNLGTVKTSGLGHGVSVLRLLIMESSQILHHQIGDIMEMVRVLGQRLNLSAEDSVIKLRVKVCKLWAAICEKGVSLDLQGELRIRNQLARVLSQWFSKSIGSQDVMMADLATESVKSLLLNLKSLALETPPAAHETEFRRSQRVVFGNYFMSLVRGLEKCKQKRIKEDIIACISSLASANVEPGIGFLLPLAFHQVYEISSSIIGIMAHIVEEDKWKEPSTNDCIREIFHNHMPELHVALARACPTHLVDQLASALLQVSYPEERLSVMSALVRSDILSSHSTVEILRSNTVATRALMIFSRDQSLPYVVKILGPIINHMVNKDVYFEVEKPGVAKNVEVFMEILAELVKAVHDSAETMPYPLRALCNVIWDSAKERFPGSEGVAVGSFVFLRLINPHIVNPEAIVSLQENKELKRSFIQLAKALQAMANGSANVKWVSLCPFQEKLEELAGDVSVFLKKVSTLCEGSVSVEETADDSSFHFLHTFLYNHLYGIRKNTSVELFHEVSLLLANLGPPQQLLGLQIPAAIRENLTARGTQLNELMVKCLPQMFPADYVPFVHESIATDGTPALVLTCVNVPWQGSQPESLLTFRLFQVASKLWDRSFYFVVDGTAYFDGHVLETIKAVTRSYGPEQMLRNCRKTIFFNLSARTFTHLSSLMEDTASLLNPPAGDPQFVSLVEDNTSLVPSLGLSAFSASVVCDSSISFNDVKLYQKTQKRFVPVTLKVGEEFLVVLFIQPSRIKLNGVMQSIPLCDVYRISKLEVVSSTVTGVADEFSLRRKSEKLVLSSCKRAEIIRSVHYSRARSTTENAPNDAICNYDPKGSPFPACLGQLVNTGLFGLVSPDEAVRDQSHRLIAALVATFNLKVDPPIEHVPGACVPEHLYVLPLRVSECVAQGHSDATLNFLAGFFHAFEKTKSEEQRLAAMAFLTPWLSNAGEQGIFHALGHDFYALAHEQGLTSSAAQVCEVVRKAVAMAQSAFDYLPVFQNRVWGPLVALKDVAPLIVNQILRAAIDRDAQGLDWKNYSSLIFLSPNEQVCRYVLDRLKVSIHAPDPESASWVEMTLLVEGCVGLFFDNPPFAQMFLGDVLYVVIMAIGLGPFDLRVALHKTLVNCLHSLLSHDPASCQNILPFLDSQRIKMLFRLNANFHAQTVNLGELPSKVSSLEGLCNKLFEYMNASRDPGLIEMWCQRWRYDTETMAFSNNTALQDRALLLLGLVPGEALVTDALLVRVLDLAVLKDSDQEWDRRLRIAVCAIYALSRMVQGAAISNKLRSYLFWVAFSMTQVDNVVVYEAAISLTQGCLTFWSGDFDPLPLLIESRTELSILLKQYESLQHLNLDTSTFDIIVGSALVRGLQLPLTRKSSFQALKSAAKMRLSSRAASHAVTYLLPLYLGARSAEQMQQLLEECHADVSVFNLEKEVTVPQPLIDFLVQESDEAFFTLLQAVLFFSSPAADEVSQYRFLVLFHYIFENTNRIRWLVYSEMQPVLRNVCAHSNNMVLVEKAFGLVIMAVSHKDYFDLPQIDKTITELLEKRKLQGLRNWEFTNPNPFDEAAQEKVSKELKYKRAGMLREMAEYIITKFLPANFDLRGVDPCDEV